MLESGLPDDPALQTVGVEPVWVEPRQTARLEQCSAETLRSVLDECDEDVAWPHHLNRAGAEVPTRSGQCEVGQMHHRVCLLARPSGGMRRDGPGRWRSAPINPALP